MYENINMYMYMCAYSLSGQALRTQLREKFVRTDLQTQGFYKEHIERWGGMEPPKCIPLHYIDCYSLFRSFHSQVALTIKPACDIFGEER